MLIVKDLLHTKGDGVWSKVSPETSTIDALRFMAEKNVGALVVLEDGILVGIISERDFVRRIAQERNVDITATVRELMTSEVITVTTEDTIAHCMKLMTNKRIRHLPVFDKGDLIGLNRSAMWSRASLKLRIAKLTILKNISRAPVTASNSTCPTSSPASSSTNPITGKQSAPSSMRTSPACLTLPP